MNKEEIQELLNKKQEHIEQVKSKLDDATEKNFKVLEKLLELLAYDLFFENEKPPDSLQKEVICSFGAIFHEFYWNGNSNISTDNFNESQTDWEIIWKALTGADDDFWGKDYNIDEKYLHVLGGSSTFCDSALQQIKNDLFAIEANLTASISFALRGDIKYRVTGLFIGEHTKEALLLAHYRIGARIVDWCRANPELIEFGEKVEGKFADAYTRLLMV